MYAQCGSEARRCRGAERDGRTRALGVGGRGERSRARARPHVGVGRGFGRARSADRRAENRREGGERRLEIAAATRRARGGCQSARPRGARWDFAGGNGATTGRHWPSPAAEPSRRFRGPPAISRARRRCARCRRRRRASRECARKKRRIPAERAAAGRAVPGEHHAGRAPAPALDPVADRRCESTTRDGARRTRARRGSPRSIVGRERHAQRSRTRAAAARPIPRGGRAKRHGVAARVGAGRAIGRRRRRARSSRARRRARCAIDRAVAPLGRDGRAERARWAEVERRGRAFSCATRLDPARRRSARQSRRARRAASASASPAGADRRGARGGPTSHRARVRGPAPRARRRRALAPRRRGGAAVSESARAATPPRRRAARRRRVRRRRPRRRPSASSAPAVERLGA